MIVKIGRAGPILFNGIIFGLSHDPFEFPAGIDLRVSFRDFSDKSRNIKINDSYLPENRVHYRPTSIEALVRAISYFADEPVDFRTEDDIKYAWREYEKSREIYKPYLDAGMTEEEYIALKGVLES